MKSYLLFTVCTLSMLITAKAQNNNADTGKKVNIVYLPDYYKGKGIVFSGDYAVGIDMTNKRYRYTPSKEDISKAEEIFSTQYNQLQQTNINVKDFFCCWVRQYIGLVDSNGNKNIIVQLVNNKNPMKIRRLLGKDWEKVFTIMLADSFYAVSNRFRINIDKVEMAAGL